ncbi:MAG: RdgB/HAM1 family non-canonical purine NTP pyrophosphatase [Verrucomicrobiota bacterium]|nr:RdgB/HAM1 family non-canonical purine NTP pyrophosphatase [Verrucomicrobiota bacterium]
MPNLLVATHNAHKTGEFRAMLSDFFDDVADLTTLLDMEEPEENGSTFAENSAIKALAASNALPDAFVIADDSGLEVDALNGAPGIYSARYSGANATDATNRDKLMEELGKPEHEGKERSARFRCVITVARGGEVLAVFDGAVEGRIADSMTGEGGFGYDPLFIPEGCEDSFGVLPEKIKNGMSHRGQALEKFRAWLSEQS